jgi:Delta7-sterol 5-desaturase
MLQQWLRESRSQSSSNGNRKGTFPAATIMPLGWWLLLLLCLMAVAAAHAAVKSSNATSSRTSTTSSSSSSSIWDLDTFHLPPDVPFPGADWLQRLATDETVILDATTGRSYSSVYAMLVTHKSRPITDSDDGNDNAAALAHPCRNFNAYINSILFSPALVEYILNNVMHGSIEMTHYFLTYVRNFLGAMLVYYGVAGTFHYFCYIHPTLSHSIFEAQKRPRPSAAVIYDQVRVAQSSMALYVLYSVVDEGLVESGYTRVYFTIHEIGGWPFYIATMLTYFACVELGIYWMHRTLHTNKFLYKYVHLKHHKYNKPETLTPWASIAFHPLDGILQACPYTMLLPIVPCHYPTHFLLLFFTAIWATYIHDAMDFNIYPIMGSKYHTVHHTHYLYNYGQVFVFCDQIFGTFREPAGPTGVVAPVVVPNKKTNGTSMMARSTRRTTTRKEE